MDLEFYLTALGLCIACAGLFAAKSLPSWIWMFIAFSLAMLPGDQLGRLRLRDPHDVYEACVWRCDEQYGRREEVAPSRMLCRSRCR